MQTISDVTFRKLCYILHRGFVESRTLAQLQQDKQMFDLADTFEPLPGFLADWSEEHEDLIRSHLLAYQKKYEQRAFDYLAILDMEDSDFMDVLSKW